MQTFLPYPENFSLCATVLDNKRLSKQLTECYQILNTLTGKSVGWKNHPAVRMWENNQDALKYYYNCILDEIYHRKSIKIIASQKSRGNHYEISAFSMPSWIYHPLVKISHQSNLARKDPVYYYEFHDYGIEGYYWPIPVYTTKSKTINSKWLKLFNIKE